MVYTTMFLREVKSSLCWPMSNNITLLSELDNNDRLFFEVTLVGTLLCKYEMYFLNLNLTPYPKWLNLLFCEKIFM